MIGEEIEGTMLTPIRFAEMRNWPAVSYYLFKCRCGNEKVIRKGNVKANNTKSCGCLSRKNEKDFAEKWSGEKGKVPWNKGKKGRIKITGADGSIEWVKVSDQAIGSHSKHYKLKQQLGIT